MKGFAINDIGDVILTLEGIQITEEIPLLLQTCRQVIGTNHGEWFLNKNEGINFDNLLTKSPNKELIRDEIQSGLFQVDPTLRIQKMEYNLNKNRAIGVRFIAKNDKGENIEGGRNYD